MPRVSPRPAPRYTGIRRPVAFNRPGERRAPDGSTEAAGTSQFQAGDTTVFRRVLRDLIEAKANERAKPFERVVNEIKTSRDPGRCIKVLLEEFANNSGQDGLGLGIDVLARLGGLTLAAAQAFTEPDFRAIRRETAGNVAPHLPAHEDVWYMLLRGIARAEAPPFQCLTIISRALIHPSPVVRTAAVESLGDLADAGVDGRRRMIRGLLEFLATKHTDRSVGVAARTVLSDLGG